ncbi:hypothetical protein IQ279_00095 [Streptomyces verrucosisporus]|uniref:hypothetical protein n=1 Tax=Streptomyces verrucosisporus TaxID=1695161 RepID=UPI0019D2D8EA|nr:hypothetical protein [Streptomyces verrucosisporus]MBN3928056.1 hypothetical protein [Streptomyces verrucosisporus]
MGLILGAGIATLGVAEFTTEGVLKELPMPGVSPDGGGDELDDGANGEKEAGSLRLRRALDHRGRERRHHHESRAHR